MSAVETKVKTTRQVIDTALGIENWDLKGYYKTGKPETAVDFEKSAWVSLEDAQKIQTDLKDSTAQLELDTQTIQELNGRIEKFKVIAQHVQEHVCTECEDSEMCEFGCAIMELKAALNNSISTGVKQA